MNQSGKQYEDFLVLCWNHQAGELSGSDAMRLEQMVLNDKDACAIFVRYSALCANLEWEGIMEPGELGRPIAYEPLPRKDLAGLKKIEVANQHRKSNKKSLLVLLMFLPAIVLITIGLSFDFGVFSKKKLFISSGACYR